MPFSNSRDFQKTIPYGDSDNLFDNARKDVHYFMNYMIQLRKVADNLRDLVGITETGRAGRSDDIFVADMWWDGKAVNGVMIGTSNDYDTRITLRGSRSYICSCPDHRRRGKTTPCKHVYALGRDFWQTISQELHSIENALSVLMKSCQLLDPH